MNGCPCLEGPFFRAGVQLEVVNANCGDDVAFTSRVAGTVGEYDLVVAFTAPQQTQVLKDKEPECVTVRYPTYSTFSGAESKCFTRGEKGTININHHKNGKH